MVSRSLRFIPLVAAVLLAVSVDFANAGLNKPLHNDGWILAAAHAPGVNGSIWRTDLWIYSDTYSTSEVTLFFCESDQDNTSAEGYTVTASGGQRVIHIEDVVDHFLSIGGGTWVGAIHYTSPLQVQVWARVYSISPDGTKSYGQLIEGIPTAHMSVNQEAVSGSESQQWMFAAKHTADGRYRVNVGVVNPTAVEVECRISISDTTGNRPPGGAVERWITLPPYSMSQLNDPFADINGGDWSNNQIRVIAYGEGGGSFAYLSVVDNSTNDAFFVRGVKKLSEAELEGLNCTQHRDGWVLAAAHAPGYHGSIWRTDLWISVEDTSSGPVTLFFNESGQDDSETRGYDLDLEEGEFVYYVEDVVDHFLDIGSGSWLGAIHYTANTDVQVWARVYSISPDGTETYGQLVEGIPSADYSPPSGSVSSTREYQWFAAAKHTSDNRFRVNLGIVNPTVVACHYGISVYATDGEFEFSSTADVPPFSMIQLSDPFAGIDGGEWSEKQMRVMPATEGCGGFAYLSVVDNATNDAYFVRGIKRMGYDD